MGVNPTIWSVGFAEIAKSKENVAVLTADLERYSGLERTFRNYPDRCFNLGIAEENMVGIAAGMAMEGIQPFMTTYAPFMAFRCADHIRHFMGNLQLNMKAIGSAAGLTAGLSGLSLLALGDIAFYRSLPGVTVLSPADCAEALKMMLAMSETEQPTYMRFCGTNNIPVVYQEDYTFEIGKAIVLRKGEKVAVVATGTTIVSEALDAAEQVHEVTGIDVTVVNMHTISPLDTDTLAQLAETHEHILTVEEHFVNGGLGSAVAEYLASNRSRVDLCRMGVNGIDLKMGSRRYMLAQCGLNVEGITKRIQGLMEDRDE